MGKCINDMIENRSKKRKVEEEIDELQKRKKYIIGSRNFELFR